MVVAATSEHDQIGAGETLAEAEIERDLAVVHVETKLLIQVAAVLDKVAVVAIERVAAEVSETSGDG